MFLFLAYLEFFIVIDLELIIMIMQLEKIHDNSQYILQRLFGVVKIKKYIYIQLGKDKMPSNYNDKNQLRYLPK